MADEFESSSASNVLRTTESLIRIRQQTFFKESVFGEIMLFFAVGLIATVSFLIQLSDTTTFFWLIVLICSTQKGDSIFFDGLCATFFAVITAYCLSNYSPVTSIMIGLSVTLMFYIISFFWVISKRKARFTIPHTPSPYILGVYPVMLNQIEQDTVWEWTMREFQMHGPVWGYVPTCWERDFIINLADPRDVERVLKTNVDNYVKSDELRQVLGSVLGSGIFIANHAWTADGGANWKLQRKIAARIFTGKNFRHHFMGCFIQHARKVCRLVDCHAASGQPLDMQSVFFKFTLDCIGQLGFGVSLGCLEGKEQPFAKAFDRAQHIATHRFYSVGWDLPLSSVLMPSERELRRCVKQMDDFARGVITERAADTAALHNKHDLLSLFLAATDDEDKPYAFPPVFLRDLVMNVAIAGRDTTACLLTWIFHMLATNPEVERKLRLEVHAAFGAAGEPTYDTLTAAHMPYLHGCVSEVLRLWPPVPIDPKVCVEDDELPSGQKVPAGSIVQYVPFVMGRDAALWPDPMEVRPERWMNEKRPSAYKFPVFQAGPRVCLGMNMAYLEAKVLTCMLLQRCRLRPQPGHQVVMNFGITLSSKTGLPMLAEAL